MNVQRFCSWLNQYIIPVPLLSQGFGNAYCASDSTHLVVTPSTSVALERGHNHLPEEGDLCENHAGHARLVAGHA